MPSTIGAAQAAGWWHTLKQQPRLNRRTRLENPGEKFRSAVNRKPAMQFLDISVDGILAAAQSHSHLLFGQAGGQEIKCLA